MRLAIIPLVPDLWLAAVGAAYVWGRFGKRRRW